jgi:hypothetical protein
MAHPRTRPAVTYTEPGGSWRPFWLLTAFLAVLVVFDLTLPSGGLPGVVWVIAFVAVLGVVGGGTITARRTWTIRVDGRGPDAALSVGRERIALSDVDTAHLRAARDGEAGVDAGAPVLGGGWSIPRGRTGLPLRLADGRTVLVPTSDPTALVAALLEHAGEAPEGDTGPRRTLDT